jgi:hypothetical protein
VVSEKTTLLTRKTAIRREDRVDGRLTSIVRGVVCANRKTAIRREEQIPTH